MVRDNQPGPRPQQRKSPQPLKPLTPDRLGNIALAYLARHAASRAHFAAVLARRIDRADQRGLAPDRPALEAKAATLVANACQQGLIDDAALAQSLLSRYQREGRSMRIIKQKLAEKGIAADLAAQAVAGMIADTSAEAHDHQAARRFAERRRLGPYRLTPARDPDRQVQRDLGALARAGFSRAASVAALADTEEDEVE